MLPIPTRSAQTVNAESEEAKDEEEEELRKLLPDRDAATAAYLIEEIHNNPEEYSDIVEQEITLTSTGRS